MMGLTSFEVYNSILKKNKNNKLELYTDAYTEFTFMESKDELEEIFDVQDITPKRLQDEKVGPLIFKVYKKLKSENSSTDAYFILLTTYAKS